MPEELITVISENPGTWKNPHTVQFVLCTDVKYIKARYYDDEGKFLYEEKRLIEYNDNIKNLDRYLSITDKVYLKNENNKGFAQET